MSEDLVTELKQFEGAVILRVFETLDAAVFVCEKDGKPLILQADADGLGIIPYDLEMAEGSAKEPSETHTSE